MTVHNRLKKITFANVTIADVRMLLSVNSISIDRDITVRNSSMQHVMTKDIKRKNAV